MSDENLDISEIRRNRYFLAMPKLMQESIILSGMEIKDEAQLKRLYDDYMAEQKPQ